MISNGTVVKQFHVLLALAIECGVGQFFQQRVGFAIQHTITLLDDCVSDGLRDVALAAARRSEEQCVLATSDPTCGSQIEDQTAIHPGIELEVEVVQMLVGVTELRLFVASLQQSPTTTGELV